MHSIPGWVRDFAVIKISHSRTGPGNHYGHFNGLSSHMARPKFMRMTFCVSRTILIAISISAIGLESIFIKKHMLGYARFIRKKYGFLVQSWRGSSEQNRADSSGRQWRWLRNNRKWLLRSQNILVKVMMN